MLEPSVGSVHKHSDFCVRYEVIPVGVTDAETATVLLNHSAVSAATRAVGHALLALQRGQLAQVQLHKEAIADFAERAGQLGCLVRPVADRKASSLLLQKEYVPRLVRPGGASSEQLVHLLRHPALSPRSRASEGIRRCLVDWRKPVEVRVERDSANSFEHFAVVMGAVCQAKPQNTRRARRSHLW
jgi:hypothetical protein